MSDDQKIRKAKNYALLRSFTNYCWEHPEERFWQALRNWAGYAVIFGSDMTTLGNEPLTNETSVGRFVNQLHDTFYDE